MSQILETERLILRSWQASDRQPMYHINQDPEVMAYFPGLQDMKATQNFIANVTHHYDKHGYTAYACVQKDINTMIGFVGLLNTDFKATFTPAIEIAWRLASKHWNKGYATELAIALIDWGLYTYKLPKIIAPVHPSNERSIRVLEKSGMQCEGTICHKGHDIPCYSIISA
jgi:RimJ/RimL family protein N-acetyltransferase